MADQFHAWRKWQLLAPEASHINVMEAALVRCDNQKYGDTSRSHLETNRQMARAFHGFIVELQAVGNAKEASRFRARQNERQRRILLSQGRHLTAALYYLWRIASDYGESLGRWAITCCLVIFSGLIMFGVLLSIVGNRFQRG